MLDNEIAQEKRGRRLAHMTGSRNTSRYLASLQEIGNFNKNKAEKSGNAEPS